MFHIKFWEKPKHTPYVQKRFSENCAVYYEIMWKNMVEQDRPQIAIKGTCALHAG